MSFVAGVFHLVVVFILIFGQGSVFERYWRRGRLMVIPWLWCCTTLFWITFGDTISKIIFTPGRELWSAAGDDKRFEVKILLLRGANPNAAIGTLGSPLSFAVRRNHVEMAGLLLDHSGVADAPAGIWGDDSLAADAAFSDHPEMLELLLKRGANPNRGSAPYKPLAMAISKDNLACVRILLAHGADYNAMDSWGNNQLEAVMNSKSPNREAIAKLLIDAGAKARNKKTR